MHNIFDLFSQISPSSMELAALECQENSLKTSKGINDGEKADL